MKVVRDCYNMHGKEITKATPKGLYILMRDKRDGTTVTTKRIGDITDAWDTLKENLVESKKWWISTHIRLRMLEAPRKLGQHNYDPRRATCSRYLAHSLVSTSCTGDNGKDYALSPSNGRGFSLPEFSPTEMREEKHDPHQHPCSIDLGAYCDDIQIYI